jgi:hypothetical protein
LASFGGSMSNRFRLSRDSRVRGTYAIAAKRSPDMKNHLAARRARGLLFDFDAALK